MEWLYTLIGYTVGCLLAELNHRWAFKQGELKGYALRKNEELDRRK